MALAAPAHVLAAVHPEGTRAQQEAGPAELVRIQVLDKVEGKRRTMTLPLAVTIPLPDTVHSIRVTRFTEDFALAEPPRTEPAQGPRQNGEAPGQSDPEAIPIADDSPLVPQDWGPSKKPEPVPRAAGEENPAALLKLYRGNQLVGSSWIFQKAPHLFQPSNMRYTFQLLGVDETAKTP
ncbi:hypothetical protein [Thiohalorhabdus methylotrophus]|uniref:DUF2381 family protein n=1 Tax=Thiohalorhabdus methylotrophus TaxID=3242694 RepID=A0ABV4U0B9_9GAMM